jgi:hypothetical protein
MIIVRKNKFLVLSLMQLVYIFYFTLTTLIFFISFNSGYEGVTIRIFGGGDDGFLYWDLAQSIARGFSLEDLWIPSIYPIILGYILKFTSSSSVYTIRIFNYLGFILFTICGLKMIDLIYSWNKEKNLWNIKAKNRAKIVFLLCLMFYASFVAYSVLSIYRDIWIYTFYLLSVFISLKLIFYRPRRVIWFLLLIFSVAILGKFRGYALLSFVVCLAVYFFYIKIFKKLKRPGLLVLICVLLFAFYYSFFMDFKIPYVNMSLSDALNYRQSSLDLYAGGSQMNISLHQPSFVVFLINYLHSYMGNLLGPLPWHIRGGATLAVFFLETIPMTLILIYLWKNRCKLNTVHKYLLLHSLVWIAFIAVSNDNIGTATRLRVVAWEMILLVFACVRGENSKIEEERKVLC